MPLRTYSLPSHTVVSVPYPRHPAFEEDEIELIALGGILGASKYRCAHLSNKKRGVIVLISFFISKLWV